MPTTIAQENIPLFPVGLVDAYLYETSVRRINRRSKAKEARPTLDTTVLGHTVENDGRDLAVLLQGEVRMPYREIKEIVIRCSVLGQFRSGSPVSGAQVEAFANRDAIVLLYPYLRAMTGEIGRMTGLPVPPLPTMDVTQFIATHKDEPAAPARSKKKTAETAPPRRSRQVRAAGGRTKASAKPTTT
jgi:hypothetical protein